MSQGPSVMVYRRVYRFSWSEKYSATIESIEDRLVGGLAVSLMAF